MTDTQTTTHNSQGRHSAVAEWHRPPPEQSHSATVLKRWWWLILLLSAAIGIATYAVSKVVPAQYSSSGSVAINVSGADASQTSVAANNLASQYAQQVTAQGVLQRANRMLSPSDARNLSTTVTGGTVSDQNIVDVQATGATPGQAERRASSVVNALIAYISNTASQSNNAYARSAERRLQPLDTQIRSLTNQLAKEPTEPVNSGHYLAVQQTLSTLIAQRSASIATIAQNASGSQPTLSVLTSPGAGGQTAPKPTLYAAVAFLIALIVFSQGFIYLSPRRA
jgi:capsular polysaccharide biosynthesis protein